MSGQANSLTSQLLATRMYAYRHSSDDVKRIRANQMRAYGTYGRHERDSESAPT